MLRLHGAEENIDIFRIASRSSFAMAWGYLLAIAFCEVLTILVEPRLGMAMHGLVLLVLFLHASLWAPDPFRRFLVCLSLVPLLRLVSLALPLPEIPLVYWYLAAGIPLFLASFAAARIGKVNRGMLGLNGRSLPIQLLVGATGIILGYAEFIILQPSGLVSSLAIDQILVPALILLVFTGLLEELIFRGLLQYSALRSFGRPGFWYVALVFTLLHLGYRSLLNLVFVLVVALYFSWITWRTGSVLGVGLAHGILNISMFLIFPLLLASPAQAPEPDMNLKAQPPAPGLLAPAAPLSTPRSWFPATPTPFLPLFPTGTITPENTRTATPCLPPEGWAGYVVQDGESLASISELLGVDEVELRLANCLDQDDLSAGQILYVPFFPFTPEPPESYPEESPTFQPTFTETPSATPQPATATPELPTSTSTLTLTPVLATQTLLPARTQPLPTPAPLPTDWLLFPSNTPAPSETLAPATQTPLPPSSTPLPPTLTSTRATETPTNTPQPSENPTGTLPATSDTPQI
ncbi:MAG: type II CAAX prenyl endopeptidase Rce1 family protein [Omnitrophica WOR_2 bacterium]